MSEHPSELDHDVVVIGAGPAGLVTATCLAVHGVDVLLLDKRAEVSTLPRAVGVSVRQMELFRAWGLEDTLRAGSDDVDLAVLDAETATEAASGTRRPINVPDVAQSAVVSPTSSVRVPQDHLERVLIDHLSRQPSCAIRRATEVTGIAQDDKGVRLSLRAAEGDDARRISAAYVVAADGAHSAARLHLGIDVTGPDDVMCGVSAEFRAPLWEVLGRHRYALYGINHPQARSVLIPAGGGTRWQLGIVLGPGDDALALSTPDALIQRVRTAAGVPHLPVEIVRVSTFSAGAKLAARFSAGRVFLAGDAAHRVTPRGGNGLAMAVRDGVALGWRLSWVVKGWAPASFLSTYEEEMRPLAAENVSRAADPDGHCHAVITELLHDLGGRMQHAWVGPGATGEGPVSTLDLVTDGLTLFVTSSGHHWHAAASLMERPVPVNVVELPPATAHALGIHAAGGALLVRPDAVPVASWYRPAGPWRSVTDLERAVDDLIVGDRPHRPDRPDQAHPIASAAPASATHATTSTGAFS